MARAKATRGRGRPAMQNMSPRQTCARSARTRAATVSAAATAPAPAMAYAAALMSDPATVSAAASAAPAVVSMGAPPPECAIREHFEDAPSFQQWCEMHRSQPCPGASGNATWNAAWHLLRKCSSRFTPWCWLCNWRQLLVPGQCRTGDSQPESRYAGVGARFSSAASRNESSCPRAAIAIWLWCQ